MTETNSTKVSMNKDLVSRFAQKRQLPEGWHCLLITQAVAEVSKANHCMITCTIRALGKPGDPDSKVGPSIRHRLVLPIQNEDVSDHEPPNTEGMVRKRLQAMGFDLPNFPRRDSESKELVFGSEIIDASEEMEKREETVLKTLELCEKLYANPEELEGYSFFGYVVVEGDFNDIKAFVAELPEGEKCVPASEIR